MAEPGVQKGTVTALGSLFTPEEAEKASKRVQDAIADRQKEVDRLKTFIADNSTIIKLVRQLPDELSHDVMVPFGSAAFFPGRIVHTNEFLVLLGEGYYAERTSKQTVEILKRRGKSLESQLEALKASLLDLETEAKFFDSAAAEIQEGVVEIWEEYTEEHQEKSELSSIYPEVVPNEEDEYARMMARLDELEKEELEAESARDSDENEDTEASFGVSASQAYAEYDSGAISEEELEAESAKDSDEDEVTEASVGTFASQTYASDDSGTVLKKTVLKGPAQKPRVTDLLQSTSAIPVGGGSHQHHAYPSSISDSNLKPLARDGSTKVSTDWLHTSNKTLLPHQKENFKEFSDMKLEDSSDSSGHQVGKSGFSARKAFTGSVIEHSYGLPSDQLSKGSNTDQPSKPVSRFKMQKGNL